MLVTYRDYQCPQCGELYALIQTIQKQLCTSGKQTAFCFIFRHFSQSQIHPQAQKAAAASEAAAAQGQFWQMHETLLNHWQKLGDGYLAEYANKLGLNVTQLVREIARKVYINCINQDIASGVHSGAVSAPALFVNDARYRDALEIDSLLAAIARTRDSS